MSLQTDELRAPVLKARPSVPGSEFNMNTTFSEVSENDLVANKSQQPVPHLPTFEFEDTRLTMKSGQLPSGYEINPADEVFRIPYEQCGWWYKRLDIWRRKHEKGRINGVFKAVQEHSGVGVSLFLLYNFI